MVQTPGSPSQLADSTTDTDEGAPPHRELRKSFSKQLLDRLKTPFKSNPSTPAERRENAGATRTVIVSVLSRMIIVPLILVPLFGWYAYKTVNRADDPVFVVVACLLIGYVHFLYPLFDDRMELIKVVTDHRLRSLSHKSRVRVTRQLHSKS